jgi:hypothetical protein
VVNNSRGSVHMPTEDVLAWLNTYGVLAGFGGTVLLYTYGSPFGQRTRGEEPLYDETTDQARLALERTWDLISYLALGLIATGAAALVVVGLATL